MEATYRGIPKKIQELLQAGEHLLVDYKGGQVPTDVAKIAAAGANSVALQESAEPFILFFGVEEVLHPNGTRSGRVVGLRERDSGTPSDIDAVEQRIINTIRSNVVPIPKLEVVRANTSGAKPFLMIQVSPTDPPHRCEDRYSKRLGSHSVPMEADELRQIFVRQRTQAFISEITDDNPLSQAIAGLAELIQIVGSRVTEIDLDHEYRTEGLHRSISEVERTLQDVATITGLEELGELVQQVQDYVQDEEGRPASDRLAEMIRVAIDQSTETIEQVYSGVLELRRHNWMVINQAVAGGKLVGDAAELGLQLFRAFFLTTPDLLAFDSNRAEFSGWRIVHRASVQPNLALDVLHSACFAATASAGGAHWDKAWAELDVALERADLASLVVEAREGFDFNPERARRRLAGGEPETALISCDLDRLRTVLEGSSACFTQPGADLLGWRLNGYEIRFAFPNVAGPVAIVSIPSVVSPDWPEAVGELRSLRRRLRRRDDFSVVRCYPTHGGILAPLSGGR